jgi:hypothetical protein
LSWSTPHSPPTGGEVSELQALGPEPLLDARPPRLRRGCRSRSQVTRTSRPVG